MLYTLCCCLLYVCDLGVQGVRVGDIVVCGRCPAGLFSGKAEATLAQETRIVELDGTIKGGPVYYITTAFKGKFGKFLAGFFAVAITLALGFMGCMVQSNSIGSTMQTAFGIPSWAAGSVLVWPGRGHEAWSPYRPHWRKGPAWPPGTRRS